MLFRQYAFGCAGEEREELVAIGKAIVKKCGGLPLAAQALEGLMRSRSDENEWLEIKDSKLLVCVKRKSLMVFSLLIYICKIK